MARSKILRYNKKITIRVELDYYYLLCRICDEQGISLTDFVRESLNDNVNKYMNEQKKEDI